MLLNPVSVCSANATILFSNVHPRSAGDKRRRLSGPTEFTILDSVLSIQHILFETLKKSTKYQNQLEVQVVSKEMFFIVFFV